MKIEYAIAQLRHAYSHLAKGTVTNQKLFAEGLIAPALRVLEEQSNEIDRLKHDLDRHIEIATALATELEELKHGRQNVLAG